MDNEADAGHGKDQDDIVRFDLAGLTSESFVSCVENYSTGSLRMSLKHPLPSF
jgi:hypothetical protein